MPNRSRVLASIARGVIVAALVVAATALLARATAARAVVDALPTAGVGGAGGATVADGEARIATPPVESLDSERSHPLVKRPDAGDMEPTAVAAGGGAPTSADRGEGAPAPARAPDGHHAAATVDGRAPPSLPG